MTGASKSHRSRLGAVIVDCEVDDLDEAAAFWGRALGLEPEPGASAIDPNYRRLGGVRHTSDAPVILQKVSHTSRVHLDIETDDIEAEVKRLQGLGATLVNRLERWVVMEAPTGHRFCVIGPQRPGFEEGANRWPDGTDN